MTEKEPEGDVWTLETTATTRLLAPFSTFLSNETVATTQVHSSMLNTRTSSKAKSTARRVFKLTQMCISEAGLWIVRNSVL